MGSDGVAAGSTVRATGAGRAFSLPAHRSVLTLDAALWSRAHGVERPVAMTQALVAYAEFGPLDFLSDLAHHSYVDGFSEKAVGECRAWVVLTHGVGDVMTSRYLLYVRMLALLDLGRYSEAVDGASELLESLGGEEEAVWRCKALSIIARAKIRLDQPSAAIFALAEA